jgi:hypothetical protein
MIACPLTKLCCSKRNGHVRPQIALYLSLLWPKRLPRLPAVRWGAGVTLWAVLPAAPRVAPCPRTRPSLGGEGRGRAREGRGARSIEIVGRAHRRGPRPTQTLRHGRLDRAPTPQAPNGPLPPRPRARPSLPRPRRRHPAGARGPPPHTPSIHTNPSPSPSGTDMDVRRQPLTPAPPTRPRCTHTPHRAPPARTWACAAPPHTPPCAHPAPPSRTWRSSGSPCPPAGICPPRTRGWSARTRC